MEKVLVISGGNIGTLIAANLAAKNKFEVSILTSDSSKWNNSIDVYDADDNLLRTGKLSKIYTDAKEAFEGTTFVICTLPSNIYHKKIAEYLPLISAETYFGIIPGMGGKEFPFFDSSYDKIKYFSFQRVPGVARIKHYGASVYDLGERDLLHYAVKNINPDENDKLKLRFEEMFGIECKQLDNLLSVTLTPSNPILHTSRLFGLSKKKNEGVFKKKFLFYGDWDDFSTETIFGLDQEVQNICKELDELSLKDVLSLKIHYDSYTVEDFTKKIRSIKSLSKIESPFIKVGNYWDFDTESRYFNEDFLYGLCMIKSFSTILQQGTPLWIRF